jgi:heterodisulfide reductase subunit C
LAIRAVYRDEKDRKRGAAEICLKCGVCCNVAHSCHVMYDHKFNPRYTFVYDCLASEKETSNPNIWLCVSCHKCEETCPYDVSPIYFIESLKEHALNTGWVHPTIRAEVTQVITTGFAFPLTGATERQRQTHNLKSLSPPPIADLAKIAEKTGLTDKLREVKQ